MTIPSTAIHFNGDGTARLVAHGEYVDGEIEAWMNVAAWRELDRPCDTCGEAKWRYRATSDPCPSCSGTRRHTFPVEVGDHRRPPSRSLELNGESDECCARTLRVSVVPGMVLPIFGPHMQRSEVQDFISTRKGGPWLNLRERAPQPITLPPNAKPGMWAVQLQVHQ